MDISHNAIPSRNGGCTSGGNRSLAGRSRDMARIARLFPGLNRDAQPHTGLFLWRERLAASPPRLQREHSARLSSSAANVELYDSKWDSFPNQKASIYARARQAANPGNADGLNRFQRGTVRIANRAVMDISEFFRHLGLGANT